MKSNEDLQKDVLEAIKWEPLLKAAEIGVTAKDGIITLTGTLNSYAKKIEAQNAAKSVFGVKAIVEKIELKFDHADKRDDNEIAKEVLYAIKGDWEIPCKMVLVEVENGCVTLNGEFEWNYQKEAAQFAANNVFGVKSVTNHIKIKSEIHDQIEQAEIKRALKRNASINDSDIQVKVSGNHIMLSGTVNSFYEKNEAERIAWNAPGVTTVDNALEIEYAGHLV